MGLIYFSPKENSFLKKKNWKEHFSSKKSQFSIQIIDVTKNLMVLSEMLQMNRD